jgi:hypothetical protein
MDRACGIQAFGRKPEGEGPFGKLQHRWEDNIKMDQYNETNVMHFSFNLLRLRAN